MTRDQRLAHRVAGERPVHDLAPDVVLFGGRVVDHVGPDPDEPGHVLVTGTHIGTGKPWARSLRPHQHVATWELAGSPWALRRD